MRRARAGKEAGVVRFAMVAGLVLLAGGCASRPGAPAISAGEARAIETYGVAASEGATLEVSSLMPYVPASDLGWAPIGRSVQGRPILATTIGRGAGERVLVIGSIHGTELEGLAVVDRLVAWLRERPPTGTVRLIRDMNPDGSASGSRGNARGVDLNRNWPAASFVASHDRGERPLSEPEALAVWREIERFGPGLVVVLHSTPSGPFVNYDGPAVDAATRFASAANVHDGRWRVVADMGYPTPGSLGSFMGVDRKVAILTVEFDRGQTPDSVWAALRDGVRAVVAGMQ